MELVNALLDLWKMIPQVYVEAFVVFVMVGFLKGAGVLGKDVWAQFANILGSFLIQGATLPKTGYQSELLFMTMLVASLYYQLWKLVKPYLKKLWDHVGGLIGFEKEAEAST